MPTVRLKVNRWLCQGPSLELTSPGGASISAPEGETILGMVRRLAAEDPGLWKAILDEKTQEIRPNVLVTLNGCLVNPYDRSEALLKEGDEVLLLPNFDGG